MMMKRLLISATLTAVSALTVSAQTHTHTHGHAEHEPSTQAKQAANVTVKDGEVVRRGAALGDSTTVKFADVLKEPQKYDGKQVIVEGVVERVCQMKGCWMQIAPEAGAAADKSVRVTFDHKFFVPKDSDKMKFRAEGTFSVKRLTAEEAAHLEKDGARLRRDEDGEATELSFLATGVELWR